MFPENDEWHSIKCLFLRKVTTSWEHISALSQDILNSYSSTVIQVINCHHCCSDETLQTEQICKGVFSAVFISLRRKWCFIRECKFLRGNKKISNRKALHLFFRAEFQWLVFFHTIENQWYLYIRFISSRIIPTHETDRRCLMLLSLTEPSAVREVTEFPI